MNNAYFYSAKTNAFYVSSLMSDYEGAGTLPDDIKEISTKWYEYLINGQAIGKIISPDEYGQPVLSEPAPPTAQELRAIAEGKKSQLMREAGESIAILQDAADLGISTEAEDLSLLALRSYRVLLSRVDVDDPVWPEKP